MTNTHFFSKHQSGNDVAGGHGEILRQIHSTTLIVDQHLKWLHSTFLLWSCCQSHDWMLLMCHLSQLEGLSLYHIVQRLLAAALQRAVDEAAVGLPLLGVVPQRDGAPATGHDIGLQKIRKGCKCYRAAHWSIAWQNEPFYQCMRRICQQSQTTFLPAPLL